MIFSRGWRVFALGASFFAALPTAWGGFDVREVSPAAALRARALALHYTGTEAERALDRERALVAFEALIAIDPSQVDVARRAATLAAGLGQRERGWQLVEAAQRENPAVVEAYLNVAKFLDRFQPEGEEEEFAKRALVEARVAEELFPQDARVCSMLVDLLLQKGDPAGAVEVVESFAERGGDAVFCLELAVAAGRCLKSDPDGEAISRSRVDALYDHALEVSGGDPDVADAVGNYYIGVRQYDRAMEVLEPVLAENPGEYLAREKLVRIYRIRGQKEKALKELRALTAAFPNEARTQRLLSELLAEEGDSLGALRHRQRAVQLGGAEQEDYIEIAAALADHFEPPRYAESLRWLDRGLSVSPGEPRLHYMKGIVLNNSGEHGAALASYRQTETIAALKMPELLDTGFYNKMANAADSAGERKEAARLYGRAVALVPDDRPELAAGPLNDHGYMLLTTGGDVNAAGELIRRAVELEPDNPVFLDSLGWYYYKKALFRKALVELRRAERLMGDDVDPEVLEHLEAVREALGE